MRRRVNSRPVCVSILLGFGFGVGIPLESRELNVGGVFYKKGRLFIAVTVGITIAIVRTLPPIPQRVIKIVFSIRL